MKHIYILAFTLISILGFSQDRMTQLLQDLSTETLETSILYQPVAFNNILDLQNNPIDIYSFYNAFNAISSSDRLGRLLPLEVLKQLQTLNQSENVIEIGILHSEFETLKKSAVANGLIQINADNSLSRTAKSGSPYKKHQLTLASTLKPRVKGMSQRFVINSNSIFNTTTNTLSSIKIDFDNNQGFITINQNSPVHVNYETDGIKELKYQLLFSDGTSKTLESRIRISYSNNDLTARFNRAPAPFTASITPDLSVYNEAISYPGEGEYEIFLSADNILDKPIFLIDGFDPGDTRDITAIYDLLNYGTSVPQDNLGDEVRALGYDVVILNFPTYVRAADGITVNGGADFIERNAMLLVDLIELVNSQKIGAEQNIVIGPSMGGLVSRYALNYMENNSAQHNHDTRLYLSFDSPHHGANVPLGFQHHFNYLANGLGGNSVTELQPIVDNMLKSNAARQMLTDHFEAHLASGNTVEFDAGKLMPEAHSYRSTFMSNINNLTTSGFPETTRNVSMINGSGIGNSYQDNATPANNISPGFTVIDETFNIAFLTDADLAVYFTPATSASTQPISKIKVIAFFVPIYDVTANAEAFSYTNGIDAASGGLFDIQSLTEGLDLTGLTGDFLAALNTDFFNFIPSVSSMALEVTNNQIDWYHDINLGDSGRAVNNVTPFANWYMPDNNEPHAQLTPDNVLFAMEEITNPALSNTDFNKNYFKIAKNPINKELVILSNTDLNNASISIVDVTGKVVYDNMNVPISSKTHIPLNLESGIYILTIETNKSSHFNTKIIIR